MLIGNRLMLLFLYHIEHYLKDYERNFENTQRSCRELMKHLT